jgi:GDP-L-fucose synthase
MREEKILLVGATGFAGQNILNHFVAEGRNILGLSRKDGLDLTDYKQSLSIIEKIKPDFIINCAAKVGSLNYVSEFAAEVVDQNMIMILNLYKIVRDCVPDAIIINPVANCSYPGSMELYEEAKIWDGPIHQSVLAYGSTRRMMLVVSECYRRQYNIKSLNFFVPNMFGPYDSTDPNKAHALNALACKCVKAKAENQSVLEVWGTGNVIREWLYAKDLARFFSMIIEQCASGVRDYPTINIGQKNGLSIKELVEIMTDQSHFGGKIFWNTAMQDGAPIKIMDNRLFLSYFPEFKFTSFEIALNETLDYYQSLYPFY